MARQNTALVGTLTDQLTAARGDLIQAATRRGLLVGRVQAAIKMLTLGIKPERVAEHLQQALDDAETI